jgi:predicted alpha/beta-hydrolase family hydrolase
MHDRARAWSVKSRYVFAVAEREVDLDGHPGLLVRPRNATALYDLAHGAGAGMRHAFMQSIADALADHAIATLRYEFPFMAAGKARPDSPAIAEATVRAVWNAGAKHARQLPRFAGGKSFGGRMTSQAQALEPLAGVHGLVFLGFPLHPAGKPSTDRAKHLSDVHIPQLFVQGTRDNLAEVKLLEPVVKNLGPSVSLHWVAEADHSFHVLVRSGRNDEQVMREILDTIAARIGMIESKNAVP